MLDDFISVNKIPAQIHFIPSGTKTATQAERAFADSGLVVVKSILLIDSNQNPALVILKGSDKVDLQKVKKILGVSDVRLAHPEEVLEITGYEVGGVPPVSVFGVKTILDSGIEHLKEVIAGGGTQNHLLQIKVADILANVEEIEIKDVKKAA